MRGLKGQEHEPPPCEWCGAHEAPDELRWETTIAGPEEPGEPLVISGTVYEPDGTTPAPGVIVFAYHTNREGVYPKRGDETGNAVRHGYLRSWMRTDERGRYRFTTIRPGAYPSGNAVAHIHMTVKEPDKAEYFIDDLVFADDPLLTEEDRQRVSVVRLSRDEEGVWRGRRDVVLEE